MSKELEQLIEQFSKLDGITKRTATKISSQIIKWDQEQVDLLVDSISKLRQVSKVCDLCFLVQNKQLCDFCFDQNRDKTVMIFEKSSNVFKFENLSDYNGHYFVVDPLIKKGYSNTTILWEEKLFNFVTNFKLNEIILAISPTINGEITMKYIRSMFSSTKIKITRFAVGMPVNSEVDYMDDFTLSSAYKNRTE